MENENDPMAPPLPESEWQEHILALRRQVLIALVLIVAVCGGADVLLLNQVRNGRAEVNNMNAMLQDYNQKVEPFLRRTVDYGLQHPEFRSVLAKYPIAMPQNTAPATHTGPALAPPTAPKK